MSSTVTNIEVVEGDLFESGMQTLVNATNCIGVMGAGIALEFQKRFPEMFDWYKERCKREEEIVGIPRLYTKSTPMVMNFPTMKHPGEPADLEDIQIGMGYISVHLEEWPVESIAFPALGCGIGNLCYEDVEREIILVMEKFPEVPTKIYKPLK